MKYPSIIRDTYDFNNDTEVCNIGYCEGKLNDGRPYRLEEWASNGITCATVFISTLKIENKNESEIKKLLVDNELIEIINDDILIAKVVDIEDNEFYSINIPLEGNKIINKCLVSIRDYFD